MSAPRRWVDDPSADEALRELLRGAPAARPLDPMTRRRLGAKVLRSSAVPAVAASWLFVKSAAAALGVVLGAGVVAQSIGVVQLSAPKPAVETSVVRPRPVALAHPRAIDAPAPAPALPSDVVTEPPAPLLNPAPLLPIAPAAAAASSTLSAEAGLLERARRQMRSAPARALSIAAEHAARFPRGQLASERALIQIEALHRLGRDAEARTLARGLLDGPSAGLYTERVRALLGESLVP
jgi:hypothetical protein